MENIIEINNLTFKYNNKNTLFEKLNVDIEKGKITDIFNVNQKDYEKSNKSYADYVREVLK